MTNYFVATTGSSGNSGLAIGSEKQTIAQAVALMSGGDRLFIRGGTYAERLDPDVNLTLPSGTAALPTRMLAYQDEPVILQPSSGTCGLNFTTQTDIALQGLTINAVNVQFGIQFASSSVQSSLPTRCRVYRCQIYSATSQGINIGPDATNITTQDSILYNIGSSDFHHGIYNAGQSNIIDSCRIYNISGYGVHNYNGYTVPSGHNTLTDNAIIRNCHIHHCGLVGDGGASSAILSSAGTNHLIHSNVLHSNLYAGVRVWDGSVSAKIYNNTCYFNGFQTGSASGYGIRVESTSVSATLANNIANANLTADISDAGSSTTQTTNRISSVSFVDVSQYDFHLLAASAATQSNSIFTTDKDGQTRGASWDHGAYQFSSGGPRLHPLMSR